MVPHRQALCIPQTIVLRCGLPRRTTPGHSIGRAEGRGCYWNPGLRGYVTVEILAQGRRASSRPGTSHDDEAVLDSRQAIPSFSAATASMTSKIGITARGRAGPRNSGPDKVREAEPVRQPPATNTCARRSEIR